MVSVVVSSQKELNKDSQVLLASNKQKEAVGKLKLFTKSRRMVLVYGGCKVAPSMATVYYDRSLIMQGDSITHQSKALIGQVNQLTAVVDLHQTSQHKWIQKCPLFEE